MCRSDVREISVYEQTELQTSDKLLKSHFTSFDI